MDVAQLYRTYGDLVLSRCRSLLRNEADAADAVQEVFLNLHRNRHKLRFDHQPSTYLYRAATNVCLNRLRTRKRKPEAPLEAAPERGCQGVLSHVAERDLLERILDSESEGTQAAVIYVLMDGMTYDEAGELLGVTGAAVRKRIGTFRSRWRERGLDWLEDGDR